MSRPFSAGERALFLDGRDRRYLVTLLAGGTFHTHAGYMSHDEVIGSHEGVQLLTPSGARFTVVRPTLTDFVVKMPRGAQVVYPKDIGQIVVGADIAPGVTVLEAGTGSGALTMGLLRAVGHEGRIISVEQRDDHARRARENIEALLGSIPDNLDLRVGDVTELVLDEPVDRIVLDLPEPWHTAERAGSLLRRGGIFCSYVPSTTQVQEVVRSLRTAGFIDVLTSETLVRTWHVEGRSVRPDHRMVAHTGFITVARYLGGDTLSDTTESPAGTPDPSTDA